MQIKSKFGKYEVIFDQFPHQIYNYYVDKGFVLMDKYLSQQKHISEIIRSLRIPIITIESSESSKTFKNLEPIIKELIDLGINKNSEIIAVGGGVIQDIAGFISSTLFRGIQWRYYPTTLLSQADSCIGGKTSINIEGYKNQIGTFYPPRQIIIDVGFLESLSKDQIDSGYGEIIKYHLLDNNYTYNMGYYSEIEYCLKVKKRYIEKDEFDRKKRKLLNYGHTFGHALESISNYEIPHGKAVLKGIDMANYISFKNNLISEERFQDMRSMYKDSDYKVDKNLDLVKFIKIIRKDKKSEYECANIVVPYKKNEFKLYPIEYSYLYGDLSSYLMEFGEFK